VEEDLRMKWTAEKDNTLRVLYASYPAKDVAEMMGIPEFSVRNRVHVLKLKKFVNVGQFAPGITPANKGKKMPSEVYEKLKHTMFQNGNIPHNTKYDGCIVLRKKKNNEQYYWIRVALGKWRLYHHVIWEMVYGPKPKGMIIAFRDGNSLNCRIENLELISRAENMKRNSQVNKSKSEREAMYVRMVKTKKQNRYGELDILLADIQQKRKQPYQFSI
jgi:hypothetical protein